MNDFEKPILWHQGLFLQPHHFQQNDIYFKSLLKPHNKYHTPFFWGCSQIQMQQSALEQRIIEIEKCEIIFQDGTWIKYPENTVIQPRSFKDISFDVEGDTPVTVYLGIKKWDSYKQNVTATDASQSRESVGTRFLSYTEPETVRDTHEGGDPTAVRKMDHFVKIFWDHEINQFTDYLMMPILKLQLDDDQVKSARDYAAPCCAVSESDGLMQILKNLRENIISRCRVFESYKLSHGFQSSDFDAHFLPHLLVLNTLNRSLPVINHIIDTADFHPLHVYAALRQIIGDLSTFTDRINALGQTKEGINLLSEYDHEDIFSCFNEAQILISEILKEISVGGESIFTMIRQDNYFTAQIPAEEFRDSYIYFLVLKSTGDSQQIINDMHHIIKIGNKQNIENMISRALPGVPVKHRLVPPPGMPKQTGSYYFRVDSKHYLWEEIKRAGEIVLFWDNAPDDISMEIVISQI